MELLKQWMINLIICSLIGAVVSVLSPKNGTERVMKVVIATFLICAFLSPFMTGSISRDFVLPDYSSGKSDLLEKIAEKMLIQAENQTVLETESLLESLGVEFISVSAEADVNRENSIYIKSLNSCK